MIFNLEELKKYENQVLINNKWVDCRPINYKFRSIKQRFKEGYLVFSGKADAILWPENQ
ncbi:MAG TPA: hypothetical protein VLA13_07430 [Massilibacterium sp.]|nr:hypothetical protein [Massilibacterium sp.]